MLQGLALLVVLNVGTSPLPLQDRDDLLRQARKDLRSEQVEDRLQALKELALLGLDVDGEPDPGVAKSIAIGARDESVEVRSEAIRLLLAGQHRGVALETLLAALDEVRRDQARIGRNSGNESELDAAAMRLRRRYALQVIEGLSQLPDDRTVKALIDFMAALPRREQGVMYVRVSSTLVDLGARDGFEAVIVRLGELEARAETGNLRKQAEQVHEFLRSSAVGLDLEGMPAPGPHVADDWRRWFSRNQKYYPARLGKITAKRDDE